MSNQEICLACQKNMQKNHEVISCKYCKRCVHKQCIENISREALFRLKIDEYVCINCSTAKSSKYNQCERSDNINVIEEADVLSQQKI